MHCSSIGFVPVVSVGPPPLPIGPDGKLLHASMRSQTRPPPTSDPDAVVFSVHTTRPDDGAGAVEVIFTDERSAKNYARSRSNDWLITSASVTRYTLGQFGARHPVAWYRDGDEQNSRATRPDRRYYPTDYPATVSEERLRRGTT